jgi:nicotinate-nucleotide adenylyltransferase
MAQIGVFSGTFDPVHNGHIAFCLQTLSRGNLDKVVLLAEATPRGKQDVAPLEHRLSMLELAAQQHPKLEVLRVHSKRFTVAETLPELRQRFPGDELSLLVGSDVVRSLSQGWPGLGQLLAEMRLLVALRADDTPEHVEELLGQVRQRFPDTPLHARLIGSPHPHAASSRIRGQAAPGQLMAPVAAYIAEHRLYAGTSAA